MADRSEIEKTVMQACCDEDGREVVDKLLKLMSPAAAQLWLAGQNSHLGGSQPLVVLKLEGSAPVLAALHAHEEGVFA